MFLKWNLLIGLRPSGPFALWKAGGEGVVSPSQPLGVVGFPVVGDSLEKNGLRNCPRVRMLLDDGRKIIEGIGKPEPVEEHLCLAKLQVRQKVVYRDEAHDAVMLLARRVVHQQSRGPGDVELFHEVGSLIPDALAFHRDEFRCDVLLHFFI